MTFAPRSLISLKSNSFAPGSMKRVGRRALLLSMAVAGVMGCDERANSDKAVLNKIDSGLAKLSGVSQLQQGENLTAAKNELAAAGREGGAGPAYTAVGAAGSGLLNQQAAVAGIAQLNVLCLNVHTTLAQLRAMGTQLGLTNQFSSGYALNDPRAAIAEVATHISAMQGSAQAATWGPSDAVKLPSLASVKQETSRLQGELQQRQQQLADLTKQRTDTQAEGETKSRHAEGLKGDEGVRAFADASESRRKADDLAINIDLVQSQIDRLKEDVALQQGQEAALNSGIAMLGEQGKLIETSWADLQKHAAAQTSIANVVVSGDEGNKTSIKALSQLLASQLNDLQQQRTVILDQFAEAEKAFGDARTSAESYIKTIQPKLSGAGKDVTHYRALKDAIHPHRFELQIGSVRRDRASVIMTEVAVLSELESTRAGIDENLKAAKLQMPDELSKIDTSSIKKLIEECDAQLTSAITDSFAKVESGDAPDPLKKASKVARLIAMYDQIALADAKTAAGDTTAKQLAETMMTDAMQLKTEVVASGLPLPALPGPLGEPPPPPAPPAAPTPDVAPAPVAPAPEAVPAAPAPTAPAPVSPEPAPSAAPTAPAPVAPAPVAPAPVTPAPVAPAPVRPAPAPAAPPPTDSGVNPDGTRSDASGLQSPDRA